MNLANVESLGEQTDRDQARDQANMAELAERVGRAVPDDGKQEPLSGLVVQRISFPGQRLYSVSVPAFCVIAQGSKEIYLGDTRYQYDPAYALLVAAEMPVVSQVVGATPERPYLSVRLNLDLVLVGSVMLEAGQGSLKSRAAVRAIDVSPLDSGLLDAMLRLVRLLDAPAEAPYLAPLIKREIVFRLLMGAQGDRLRSMVINDGHTHRVAQAMQRIRADISKPIQVESIARELGMSPSSFYHHFRAVASMSPLQFQKRLRLQEARRLMVGEHLDAASAAFRVGYEDASYFSREYKSLFGNPPMRDVARLRQEALDGAGKR